MRCRRGQDRECCGQEREKRRAASCALLWIPRGQTGGRLSAALGAVNLPRRRPIVQEKREPGLEPAPFVGESPYRRPHDAPSSPRNLARWAVLRAPLAMINRRRTLGLFGMLLVAFFMGAVAPRAAEAHGRIFIGIGPVYPYQYYYAPPLFVPYPAPVWADVPPAGWVPPHWERHYDRAGRPYDVWVPSHLR